MHLPDITAQLLLVRRHIKVFPANMVHRDSMAHRRDFNVERPPAHPAAHRPE